MVLEGLVPHRLPPQDQPGLAQHRKGCWPLGTLRPQKLTQPHKSSGIRSTATTHCKKVLWLGEGMKSSPAPRFEAPPASQLGGGYQQRLTSVPAENRCEAKKANMPKSQRASSAEGIVSRETLAAVCRNSTDYKRPSSCCYRREVSTPPPLRHRWELPGNYPIFTVVMVIYHYIERIWRILVTTIFLYNIYDH